MDVETLDGGVTRIRLEGDLDMKGAGEIEPRFTAVASAGDKVVVDLAGVRFLASIGIRSLLAAAKACARRGGKLALLDPSDAVAKVLTTCGADAVVPVVHGWNDALALVSSE
jgi:anti-sigma B factor antagonist